jgi:hypothetical protein
VLGTDADAKPVQIIQKSVKNFKEKAHTIEESLDTMDDGEDFEKLDSPSSEFHSKNIIPIPNILTKVFIQLPSTSPFKVAKAFLKKVSEDPVSDPAGDSRTIPSEDEEDPQKTSEPDTDILPQEIDERDQEEQVKHQSNDILPKDIVHIIQFCHLCKLGKIAPVLYSLSYDPEIHDWFNSLPIVFNRSCMTLNKRQLLLTEEEKDDDSEVSSPENKISKKDHYLINTMIKLHDSMDKTSKSKEEKEPGFTRLESHRKQLILNASAVPPFLNAATTPTEFYKTFLAKKSQFKAKDMLLYRFHADKVAFNPNSTFITNLWNCEFFWILPDSPSGISLFFCPETKSLNSYELEKERKLALADKINAADIEKLAKQKVFIPTQIMDLVWSTQNFQAVIALCFGPRSHSATFLQEWIDHIYDSRLIYSSAQSSDPFFFAKVMFAIDNALQQHWRSCSSAPNRASVNDSVLHMSAVQESILSLNFTQRLPKSISDKVQPQLGPGKDDKNGGIGKNGKRFPGASQDQDKDKQDMVYDSDKSHQKWRVKENENFSRTFYRNQKECPKSTEGKPICMKFLIRGFCTKNCMRAHTLTAEDTRQFDEFIEGCRLRALKPDF